MRYKITTFIPNMQIFLQKKYNFLHFYIKCAKKRDFRLGKSLSLVALTNDGQCKNRLTDLKTDHVVNLTVFLDHEDAVLQALNSLSISIDIGDSGRLIRRDKDAACEPAFAT